MRCAASACARCHLFICPKITQLKIHNFVLPLQITTLRLMNVSPLPWRRLRLMKDGAVLVHVVPKVVFLCFLANDHAGK